MNFTALVVEDDTLQRETLADLLKDEGLEVIECTTAEAAELVVASTGTELKALITDVSLGGEMSGSELAQYAKRRFPHINVVVISIGPFHNCSWRRCHFRFGRRWLVHNGRCLVPGFAQAILESAKLDFRTGLDGHLGFGGMVGRFGLG
jgi:hypothetical protein